MDLQSPKRHSALVPSQAGMVEVTGVCVDSGSLFWNLSIISRVSHCRAGLRLRRDRHTGKRTKPCFSSHMPLYVPPNFMFSVSPLVSPCRSHLADKKQLTVAIREEKKYFLFFLGRMNALFIYGLFKWGLAM